MTEGLPADYGHFFTKKSFHKPTYCHHCTELLWGLIGQGLVCKVCNYVIHEKCAKQVATPCTSYLTDHIKNPSAHCWSDMGTFKKKFCNVCRRKLEESPAYRCEICEYYTHAECKEFMVSHCKQCATYTPHIDQNLDGKEMMRMNVKERPVPSNLSSIPCHDESDDYDYI